MSNEQALLNCTFGWGKTCRLYYDSIEVAGKSYDLKDLTSIHPSYRIVLGIPSARLELSFGLDHLVLRGIADLDIARLMVSHLQPYCSTTPHTAHTRTRSSRARNLARAQARAWEPTNKLPAIIDSPAKAPRSLSADDSPTYANTANDKPTFAEEPPTDEPILLAAVPKAPVEDTSLTPSETLEAFAQLASNLSTYASPLPTTLWQPPHTPRFQPPLHSVHLIPPNQKFDSNSIPVPTVKSSVLPIIHVPVRLQHGECAHYSIGATLCSDRISSSARATYPLLDQGLLILTNRRVLYIGKRCQFTLAYSHLWYVSLLRTSIALHIEGQFRRIIIELEHAHEWASRIELLAFIARRARPEPPTISVAAVPGLNMTVKRKAIKPSAAKGRISANNTTVPLLSERVSSRIVEAETIEISDAAVQACADHKTLDFPSAPATSEAAETAKGSAPAIADQPTRTDMTMREVSQPQQLENAPTREFPDQPDVATLATQEFSLQSSQSEAENTPAQAGHSGPDVATLATREFSLQPQQAETENAPAQAVSPGSDVASMATREFSLQPACSEQEPSDQPYVQEKMTQGLQLEQEEIARLQAAQPPEQKREITTSALYNPDPALSLAVLARNRSTPAESNAHPIQGPADPDDDDRTIHLHDRKLSQLRTVSLREPISDMLPDLEIKRRAPRVRAPQRPS
jgi:hypothetical protein